MSEVVQSQEALSSAELALSIHEVLYSRHNIEWRGHNGVQPKDWPHYCAGEHHRSEGCEWVRVPNYPGSMADAWPLAEQVTEQESEAFPRGLFLSLNGAKGYAGWSATFHCAASDREFSATGATAAEAICRAALKALRARKDGGE